MRRLQYLSLSFLLLFSIILSACTNNKTAKDNSSKAGKSSSSTLVYARGADSVSLDPINVTDGESIRVTHAIFETLFTYDKDLKLQPKLAEDYETSKDGLTWTIH